MSFDRRSRKSGFSLIELLIVIRDYPHHFGCGVAQTDERAPVCAGNGGR